MEFRRDGAGGTREDVLSCANADIRIPSRMNIEKPHFTALLTRLRTFIILEMNISTMFVVDKRQTGSRTVLKFDLFWMCCLGRVPRHFGRFQGGPWPHTWQPHLLPSPHVDMNAPRSSRFKRQLHQSASEPGKILPQCRDRVITLDHSTSSASRTNESEPEPHPEPYGRYRFDRKS